MSRSEYHIIHRQVIELELESTNGAYRLQRQASELFKTTISKALQQAFDEIGLREDVLQIAKLEVDLGDIKPGNFEREFVEKCSQAVRRAVQEAHATARWTGGVTTTATTDLPIISNLIKGDIRLLEGFHQFLLTGCLPTPWHRKSQAGLDELWDELLVTSSDKAIALLASYSPSFRRVLPRLVRQFRPTWIAKLIDNLGLNQATEREVTFEEKSVKQSAYIKQETSKGDNIAWWKVLPTSLQEVILGASQKHFRLDFWSLDKDRQFNALEVIIASLLSTPAKLDVVELKRKLDQAFSGSSNIRSDDGPSREKADKDFKATTSEKIAAEEDHLFVTGTGIVLLHPFLPKLLEHLGWIENGEWINPKLQERTLHLLSYLVAGEQSASEHEMLLSKVLCGYPLEQMVDRFLELTAEEKIAADGLLDAVVKHWSALGNSSPDALREAFLQRDGLLYVRPNGYLLRVERKSPDVLLEKLPWGIGMIHFPWLGEKMTVEW